MTEGRLEKYSFKQSHRIKDSGECLGWKGHLVSKDHDGWESESAKLIRDLLNKIAVEDIYEYFNNLFKAYLGM